MVRRPIAPSGPNLSASGHLPAGALETEEGDGLDGPWAPKEVIVVDEMPERADPTSGEIAGNPSSVRDGSVAEEVAGAGMETATSRAPDVVAAAASLGASTTSVLLTSSMLLTSTIAWMFPALVTMMTPTFMGVTALLSRPRVTYTVMTSATTATVHLATFVPAASFSTSMLEATSKLTTLAPCPRRYLRPDWQFPHRWWRMCPRRR